MKKFFIILIGGLIFSSCGKSEEEKLSDMIAEVTKSSLYIPDSYDPVSLSCDSLMTTVINRDNMASAVKFVELMKEAKEIQRDIDWNTEQMEFWRGRYGEGYKEYFNKVQRAVEKQNKKIDSARSIAKDIYSQICVEPEFVGHLVDHKFRAKNNAGSICFGENLYILNKDKTAVIDAFDANNEDMLYLSQLISTLKKYGRNCNIDELDMFEISDNIKSRFDL